ncbi:MAG TPA: 3-phosphoshikimate 1-carboxyvinyltransferase, partial [Burkholderiales bacterium]|nr:3-phosphoshikimate 1-carboxyvinyltransferase [Burkholderiales bacterium]
MDSIELKPLQRARGTVRLPGSKSISNRILLLAALAQGETEIGGLLDADDTRVMQEALKKLGARFSGARVEGVGGPFPVKKADLFLGNAGTAFRPLTAALAFSGGVYHLSGVARMHERPIGDLVDALRGIGARLEYAGNDGFPPLAIHPGKVNARRVKVRGDVSSQFLTALLMALPLTGMDSAVEVQGELISKPYVEITLNVMRRFGVEVQRSGWRSFEIPRQIYVSPGRILVEGDASSASYFLAAGALGGGPVRVEGVGRASIQGDVRFTEVLERMGAKVLLFDHGIEI